MVRNFCEASGIYSFNVLATRNPTLLTRPSAWTP